MAELDAAIDERRGLVADLERIADRGWLSARIGTLLAHYWTPDSQEGLAKVIASDWIGILCHLPKWAIEQACHDWLASPDAKRKPVPGQIRELAVKAMEPIAAIRRDIDHLQSLRAKADEPAPPTPEARARMEARLAEFHQAIAEKETGDAPPKPDFKRVQRDGWKDIAAAASRVLGYAVSDGSESILTHDAIVAEMRDKGFSEAEIKRLTNDKAA